MVWIKKVCTEENGFKVNQLKKLQNYEKIIVLQDTYHAVCALKINNPSLYDVCTQIVHVLLKFALKNEFIFAHYILFTLSAVNGWWQCHVPWSPSGSPGAIYGPFILPRNCIVLPLIDYISAARHHSVTVFQVKMNSTLKRHRNAVTSHECSMRQRTAIAV